MLHDRHGHAGGVIDKGHDTLEITRDAKGSRRNKYSS